MKSRSLAVAILLAFLAICPSATLAADALQLVPRDALCFIVVNNLDATNAKADQLLKTLHAGFPTPSAFLSIITGVSEGIDPMGNVLLAVLPADGNGPAPKFCVWLPIGDYDHMLKALNAPKGEGISEFQVAEENLLIARHGEWALVMDADQRDRMSKILAASPSPPAAVARYRDWINENDVAVVIFREGIRSTIVWAAQARRVKEGDELDRVDEVFDEAVEAEEPLAAGSDQLYAPIRAALATWIMRYNKITRLLIHSDAIGCAVRLDEQGNALASARMDARSVPTASKEGDADLELPNSLYKGGDFLYYGAGRFPQALAVAADTLVRTVEHDLKTEQRLVLDKARLARFQAAVQETVAQVTSFALLKHPGGKSEGLATNDFVVVRATTARAFVEKASYAMRLWNSMNREATSGNPLIFDVQELKVSGRDVFLYSLDVASADGPAIPEARQLMEAFFGPAGKYQLWLVPVDERTVIFAAATENEIKAALESLDRKQPITWDAAPLADANKLLPAESDWRFFLNLPSYVAWSQKHSATMTGPVFGGRRKREFPQSPPIAFAGRTLENEITFSAVMLADTIKAASEFLNPASK